jgi:hypothetical protein
MMSIQCLADHFLLFEIADHDEAAHRLGVEDDRRVVIGVIDTIARQARKAEAGHFLIGCV